MADEAEAAPPAGQAEYDYNALLGKLIVCAVCVLCIHPQMRVIVCELTH